MIPERLTALREEMKRRSIDIYVVPTADFHESEYVGEHFKARKYLFWEDGSPDYVQDYLEDEVAMFVRAQDLDGEGLKKAASVFGKISPLARKDTEPGEFAFVTETMKERDIKKKVAELEKLGVKILAEIRIGDL